MINVHGTAILDGRSGVDDLKKNIVIALIQLTTKAHSFWVKESHGHFHSTEQDAGWVPATVPPLPFPGVKMIWGHPKA